jgi:class 3 adenylate cyclase
MVALDAPWLPLAPSETRTQEMALLLFEVRRVPRPASAMSPEVADRVLNRCLLSALEALTAAGAEVTVAGTETRPAVESRFGGPGASERAARAALAVVRGVRRVQRAAENEFRVVGAIAAGATATDPGGVIVTVGGPDVALQRLLEAAAPDQVVMSAAAREACAEAVQAVPLGGSELAQGSFLLRGVRSPDGA